MLDVVKAETTSELAQSAAESRAHSLVRLIVVFLSSYSGNTIDEQPSSFSLMGV